jgi:hypothetical protein
MSNDNTPDHILDDSYEVSLLNQELDHMEQIENDEDDNDEQDQFLSDADADSDALASCGWGTDEAYQCFGGDE